jgi:hypothetical protein
VSEGYGWASAFSFENAVMRTVKIVLGIGLILFVGMAAMQIGEAEVANLDLREDLHDIASQAGVRIGMISAMSDEELAAAVIRKAHEHRIQLTPDAVTVRRESAGGDTRIHLAADYTVPVKLMFFSLSLHFAPSSDK